ncbi:MAG: hypothetical protein AAGC60_10195 [Acidobacteriota bacterium]
MSEPSSFRCAPLPLVVLGGRDRRGTELPTDARQLHHLEGYKGAELQLDGRPLIEVNLERLRSVGAFDPIFVAGPRRVYGNITAGAEIIDTDGSFADNLRAALEVFAQRTGGDGPVVFTTCDIVPDPDELRHALADLDTRWPVDFWMPQVRIPQRDDELGSSSYKPRYRLQPHGGGEAVPILPSHFILGWPRGIRIRFVLKLFEFLYRTRNRSVGRRFAAVALQLIPYFMIHEPRALLSGLRHAPILSLQLARGRASADEMERRLHRAFYRTDHRRAHPERRGYVPLLDALSLARDIDTLEEASELADEL